MLETCMDHDEIQMSWTSLEVALVVTLYSLDVNFIKFNERLFFMSLDYVSLEFVVGSSSRILSLP
jgi:hypothetical protein